MNGNRLVRSQQEQMVAGVCGGLAHYFGIDVTIVRLLFVLVGIVGGSSIPIYLALWLVLPVDSAQLPQPGQPTIKANFQDMKQQAQSVIDRMRGGTAAQPDQSSWRFDPYTGQPVQPKAEPDVQKPRFDPYTGEPLN